MSRGKSTLSVSREQVLKLPLLQSSVSPELGDHNDSESTMLSIEVVGEKINGHYPNGVGL